MPFEGIPPWIQPADPAAHMATGLQIGARLGAEQAAQQFQAMQMARQEQLQAQEQARFQAEFGLREAEAKRTAEAAARKSAAILAYQQEVTSGGDPLQAILKYGPAMQEPGTAMGAAYRAMIPRKPSIAKVPKFIQGDPETGQPDMIVDEETGALLHVQPIPRPEKTAPDISPSERAQTLKALSEERKEIFEENPALQFKLSKSPDKLTDQEKEAVARLTKIRLQEEELLPRLARTPLAGSATIPNTSQGVRILGIRPAGTPAAAPVSVNGPAQPALPGVSGPPPMLGQAATPGALPPAPGAPGTVPPPWLRTLGRLPLFRPITDQFIPPPAVPQETEGGQP